MRYCRLLSLHHRCLRHLTVLLLQVSVSVYELLRLLHSELHHRCHKLPVHLLLHLQVLRWLLLHKHRYLPEQLLLFQALLSEPLCCLSFPERSLHRSDRCKLCLLLQRFCFCLLQQLLLLWLLHPVLQENCLCNFHPEVSLQIWSGFPVRKDLHFSLLCSARSGLQLLLHLRFPDLHLRLQERLYRLLLLLPDFQGCCICLHVPALFQLLLWRFPDVFSQHPVPGCSLLPEGLSLRLLSQ